MKYCLCIVLLCASACSSLFHAVNYETIGSPAKCETEVFVMKIAPYDCWREGCSAFDMTVRNKLETEIAIDWDKTLWAYEGNTNGRLVKAGTRIKNIGEADPITVIFAKSEFSANVAPADKMKFFGGGLINDFRYGWAPAALPSGANGVYLTVTSQGKSYQCLAQYTLVYTPK